MLNDSSLSSRKQSFTNGCMVRNFTVPNLDLLSGSCRKRAFKTSLPILIEDSLIFKNIESKTNEAIIECLAKSSKQIFVAMDQLSLLSERIRIVLRSSRFMRVSRKMPAFGELWNLKD